MSRTNDEGDAPIRSVSAMPQVSGDVCVATKLSVDNDKEKGLEGHLGVPLQRLCMRSRAFSQLRLGAVREPSFSHYRHRMFPLGMGRKTAGFEHALVVSSRQLVPLTSHCLQLGLSTQVWQHSCGVDGELLNV